MRKILLPPILLIICLSGMLTLKYNFTTTPIGLGVLANASYLLIALGILLPVWGSQVFKRVQTNILPYNDPDKMVTSGPFQFSRNPMYLGMMLILTGTAVKLGFWESFGFVAVFFGVANWWYIPFEEGRMHVAFGDEFIKYKNKVRRWL